VFHKDVVLKHRNLGAVGALTHDHGSLDSFPTGEKL
jgi:hypothetical protein